MEKSKAKSLNKAVTISKLELTAATLASRLNKTIVKRTERKFEINRIHVLDRLYDRFKVHHEQDKKIRHFRGKSRRYQTRVDAKSVMIC